MKARRNCSCHVRMGSGMPSGKPISAELDTVTIESNHTIEIDSFVPRDQMDERYLDSPYYIVPNEPVGQEAFAVIRDAMRGKDMVALRWGCWCPFWPLLMTAWA